MAREEHTSEGVVLIKNGGERGSASAARMFQFLRFSSAACERGMQIRYSRGTRMTPPHTHTPQNFQGARSMRRLMRLEAPSVRHVC